MWKRPVEVTFADADIPNRTGGEFYLCDTQTQLASLGIMDPSYLSDNEDEEIGALIWTVLWHDFSARINDSVCIMLASM